MITVIDSSRFKIDRKYVSNVALEYLVNHGVSTALDLNIVFVGKRKMLHIATVYKREPEALPVLSFPYLTDKKMMKGKNESNATDLDVASVSTLESPNEAHSATPVAPILEANNLLGEVFICYPQAVLLAAERNKKVNDILKWLIEHGVDNLVNK